jgi:hypothetical protein
VRLIDHCAGSDPAEIGIRQARRGSGLDLAAWISRDAAGPTDP